MVHNCSIFLWKWEQVFLKGWWLQNAHTNSVRERKVVMEEDAEKNQKDNAKQVKETLYKTEVIA